MSAKCTYAVHSPIARWHDPHGSECVPFMTPHSPFLCYLDPSQPACLPIKEKALHACRVLFWLAVLLAIVMVIHMAILAAFLFSRWPTPSLLHFPRPELLVLLIALAAIAQGAASKQIDLSYCLSQHVWHHHACILLLASYHVVDSFHLCSEALSGCHSTQCMFVDTHNASMCAKADHVLSVTEMLQHFLRSHLRNSVTRPCSSCRAEANKHHCKLDEHHAVINMISAGFCCAGLFTGNSGQIAVGVVLVVLLPVGFLVASAFFIWRYLYHPRAPQRRAAFILLDNPDEPMVSAFFFGI